jgi:hypothetical protein
MDAALIFILICDHRHCSAKCCATHRTGRPGYRGNEQAGLARNLSGALVGIASAFEVSASFSGSEPFKLLPVEQPPN